MTQASYSGGNETYTYDQLGNRVTYEDTRNSVTTTYTNNEVNEYEDIDTGGGAVSVFHDAAGNLSADEADYEYEYDHDNRLTKVEYDAGGGPTQVASFVYDALGRMIEMTASPTKASGVAPISRK